MGEPDYRSGAVTLRPMTAEDARTAHAIAWSVLGWTNPDMQEDRARQNADRRFAYNLETDPGGCTIAEVDGVAVGVAVAILREGIWGLALLAVREEHQGRGVGRRLLDAALTYGAGARGAMITSSEDPKALRRYARAGFDLVPAMDAAGVLAVDRPDPPAAVDEPAPHAAVVRAAPISRAVRGAAHGEDVRVMLAQGDRLLMLGDRGFVVHSDGSPRLLAARDDDAAAGLLRAAFAQAPRGATVQVHHITAGQDWAVRTCLDAGLALSTGGPTFVRGKLGPMRPYLPSGAWL
jgi:GNAT superfamily N-acetyltransferase